MIDLGSLVGPLLGASRASPPIELAQVLASEVLPSLEPTQALSRYGSYLDRKVDRFCLLGVLPIGHNLAPW